MQKNYLITRILILLSLPFNIGFCHLAYSQDVVLSELSLGTATTTSLPILGNYGYSYSQMLYFKSDMNEQVQGANSLITKVRFYYNAGSVSQSKDWVIYMGHTTINSFTSATSWVPLTNLVKVFSGDISVLTPEQGGWFEIELQTPFPYNGISNLVLAVDENTPGFYNLSFRQHSGTSANRSILYRNDTNNPTLMRLHPAHQGMIMFPKPFLSMNLLTYVQAHQHTQALQLLLLLFVKEKQLLSATFNRMFWRGWSMCGRRMMALHGSI